MRVRLVPPVRRVEVNRTSLVGPRVVVLVGARRPSLGTLGGQAPVGWRQSSLVPVSSRGRQRRRLVEPDPDVGVQGGRRAPGLQEEPKVPLVTIRGMGDASWIRDSLGSEGLDRDASRSLPEVGVREAASRGVPDGRRSAWMMGVLSTGVLHGVPDRDDVLAAERIAGEDLLDRTGEDQRPAKMDIDFSGLFA